MGVSIDTIILSMVLAARRLMKIAVVVVVVVFVYFAIEVREVHFVQLPRLRERTYPCGWLVERLRRDETLRACFKNACSS